MIVLTYHKTLIDLNDTLGAFWFINWITTGLIFLKFGWFEICCTQSSKKYINPVLTQLFNQNASILYQRISQSVLQYYTSIRLMYSIYEEVRHCFSIFFFIKWWYGIIWHLLLVVNWNVKTRLHIWRLPSLSELIPMLFNTELTHFGSEASIPIFQSYYMKCYFKIHVEKTWRFVYCYIA